MQVRAIRRLVAVAASGLVASILFVAPVLAASAVTHATRLPGMLAPGGPSAKVPPSHSDKTLVTQAVTRAPVPSAGYRGASDSPRRLERPVSAEETRARSLLAELVEQHPILDADERWARTQVSFGPTPDGYQAVAYYATGRIVVDPKHTATLARIVRHEAWHVIDYRDNGRIDWGERVPRR